MEKGYFSLILHGHLPFVRHPEHENFLEESWFYEAITETYVPLISVFEKLAEEKIHFRVTMTLSPTLLSMFLDPLLQDRYVKHIHRLIELANKEVERTRFDGPFNNLARMYLANFTRARDVFLRYGKNLVTPFKQLQEQGYLEIISCGATHGFFPLLGNQTAIRAQVKVAVDHYKSIFGRAPVGFWLPECAYTPDCDQVLKENGVKYFFLDAHGVLHASPRPKYGTFAPIYCRSGVAAFGRDLESSKQVWSSVEGYPGDYLYREFYRDVGFDLDFEYVKPYIHPDGIRVNTGMKYYRITGLSNHKEPYDEHLAREKAADHAGNFLFNRHRQVEYLYDLLGKKPIIVSPYDAELYGHWWFEGPQWLDFLIRKIHYDQDTIRMVTPFEYLSENPKNQVATPSMSSWGYKGYNEVWLQGTNDWIYRHLHKATERMNELANQYGKTNVNGVTERSLNQALRELLLAQSSDWAFIIGTGTHVSYAVNRTKDHLLRFNRIYEDVKSNRIDEHWLKEIEHKDNIFPYIDYRVYQS